MRILLTGATGFAGRTVAGVLHDRGHEVTILVRNPVAGLPFRQLVGTMESVSSLRSGFSGTQAVVHLAASNPPRFSAAARDGAAMTAINATATATLARMAADAGAGRFVFASSVRVYGAGSDRAFVETDPLRPGDPYARSKAEAEDALHSLRDEGMAGLAILRLPVIHAPGRGGWLGLAARLGRRGWLLPRNLSNVPRSVLNRDNLADAIAACLSGGATGTFNIADEGTTSLGAIGRLACQWAGRRRPVTLPGLPGWMMDRLPLVGETLHHARRPCVVDTRAFAATTGWRPPVTLEDGLRASFCGQATVAGPR